MVPMLDSPLIVYPQNLSIVKVLVSGFICSRDQHNVLLCTLHGMIQIQQRLLGIGPKRGVESNHTLVTVLLTEHGGR